MNTRSGGADTNRVRQSRVEPEKILIQGPPGVGKTTVIKEVANALSCSGNLIGGFYTEEIREGMRRAGFMVKTFSGDEARLATVGGGDLRVGRYSVDIEAFESVAVPALNVALDSGFFLIVDEIGRMELLSLAFRRVITEVLNSEVPFVSTIGVAEHPFIATVLARSDVRVYRITLENRGGLTEKIITRLHLGNNL